MTEPHDHRDEAIQKYEALQTEKKRLLDERVKQRMELERLEQEKQKLWAVTGQATIESGIKRLNADMRTRGSSLEFSFSRDITKGPIARILCDLKAKGRTEILASLMFVLADDVSICATANNKALVLPKPIPLAELNMDWVDQVGEMIWLDAMKTLMAAG